jgi:membrane-bound serine protease (ClpP class)
VLAAVLAAMLPRLTHAAQPAVDVAYLQGEVTPVMASYLESAVSGAEQDGASALVVVTDTPGGLSSAMDDISRSFLNATVPVLLYVSPSGARADSAGLFIAQAAGILAMAPNTNIGSAHPVFLSGPGGAAPASGDPETAKVLNDAVARIRAFAVAHHRNADWCEQAVRESVNITAADAVGLHVADLQANDIPDLLNAVDGRTAVVGGRALRLHTAGAQLVYHDMSWLERLLQTVMDPNVAYLLFLVALVGVGVELTHPGVILPGVAGVIAGILAVVALYGLDANVAGVVLILFGIGLFVADIKATTHGVLTIGGLVALLAGSTFLFTPEFGPGLNPAVMLLVAAACFGFFVLVLRKVIAARLRPAFTGGDSILGSVGAVREDLDPEGMVLVQGALWKAVAQGPPIVTGSRVTVVGRSGLTLQVAAAEPAAKGESTQ